MCTNGITIVRRIYFTIFKFGDANITHLMLNDFILSKTPALGIKVSDNLLLHLNGNNIEPESMDNTTVLTNLRAHKHPINLFCSLIKFQL
jgi:hypothetical protein